MVQYMCLFWVGYHLQPILIALVAAGALFYVMVSIEYIGFL